MPALPLRRALAASGLAVVVVPLAALVALAPPRAARAEDAGWRTQATGIAFGRMNPVALGAYLELASQRRLYEAVHPLRAQNHARLAAGLELTPASISPGVNVELQPLSVLTLGAGYAPQYYTGGVGLAQSYPSPRVALGGGAFRPVARGPGAAYPLLVHRFLLRGAVQAKVKAFAARAAVEATRVETALHRDDRVYYDGTYDVLVYRRGWVAQGDLDLAWLPSDDLLLAVRTTLVEAFYPRQAFADGERGGLDERTTLRVGPIVRAVLFRGRGGLVDEGAIIGAAQWWLAHPDRAGRTSPQAVPLGFVALQVSGAP